MPPLTAGELDTFLKQAPIARLGSLNPDGTIHLAPVWFSYDENGHILVGTQDLTRKARNVKHNPKVSVLVDTQEPPYKGILIYGQAELDYVDAATKRVAIFEKYLPAEQAREIVGNLASRYTQVIIRIRPDRIISFDYAKG